MIGFMKSFRELLQDHIDLRYDGNAAAFARATGFKPQTVSAWRQGKVTIPQLATRRVLAKELGITPIELLISMDVIDRSEVDAPSESDPPIVREVRAILEGKDFTEKEVGQVSRQIQGLLELMEK